MKKLTLRRWQRIVTLFAACIVAALFWPFLNTTHLREFWPSAYFKVPKPAKFLSADNSLISPQTFNLVLSSENVKLIAELQQQGWPAYLYKGKIYIGPYLASFKAQLDLDRIRQITSIPVRIEKE